jgi:hypothetical protein
MHAAADGGVPALDEAVEQRVHSAPIGGAGEGRVLARHTDPGMPHHQDQEACLALCHEVLPAPPDARGDL